MKTMWEGTHKVKRKDVIITCYYEKKTDRYTVEVIREMKSRKRSWKAKQTPKNDGMFVGDMETSVKMSNKLIELMTGFKEKK